MQFSLRTVAEACGLAHALPAWQSNREELRCPDKPLGCGLHLCGAAQVAEEERRVKNLSESQIAAHRVRQLPQAVHVLWAINAEDGNAIS